MKGACSNQIFDVIIIGGGITGSTTSVFLKKLGYKVAIIEKTNLNKFKAGESLSPECKRFFNLMDFNLDETIATDYYANHSSWGSRETVIKDFIFNPYGCGISIDRQLLEQHLMKHTCSSGNEILLESTVLQIQFCNDVWEIRINKDGVNSMIRSRLIIFATGRVTPFKTAGLKRSYRDKLVAITMITKLDELKPAQKYLTIEAMKNGWFYTNIIPQGKRVLTFFSDFDILPKSKYEYFKDQLKLTNWFQQQGDGVIETNNKLSVADARTSWSNCQSGYKWIEIGDAAYTIDPLSGQGILKNFDMINFCIDHMESFLKGDVEIHQIYNDFNLNKFNSYQQQRENVYGMESRWEGSAFWLRRRGG